MRVEREDHRLLVTYSEPFDVPGHDGVELLDTLLERRVRRLGREEGERREVERGDGEEEVSAAETFAVCEFLYARNVESARAH